MSLDSLRRLRMDGQRPASVNVIVGKPPAWFEADRPTVVVIDRDPNTLDLRPLVGLPIHLTDIQPNADLLLKALDATQALGVQVLGACSEAGACGCSPEHEAAMRRYRENLCQK